MKRGKFKGRLQKETLVSLLLISLALFAIPLISAYNWGYGYSSPWDYLENEWVQFGLVFVFLFWAIYTFINRRVDNIATAAIPAGGFSLVLTMIIIKRGILDAFLNPELVDWILIIAILIGVLFLFYRFGTRKDEYGNRRFSLWRFVISLIILSLIFIIFDILDLERILPETIMYGPFGDFIEFIQGLGWIAWIIIIALLIIPWLIKRKSETRRHYRQGYAIKAGELAAEGRRGWFARKPQYPPPQQSSRQIARLEAAKRKREEHRRKRANRLPMHQGNVNKRLFRKYGIRR